MAGEEIIIDYTDMIDKVRGFRYLLVVVDAYTGWPEAIPCRREDADSVIKFLVTHYIPLHGFPRKVRSDNGSHFKNHDLRTVEESLGLRHRFGAVYHPQSQGKVVRMNQNLKQKLSKACEETGMQWLDALPLALMSIRSSINKGTGFSPFELTHGHQFPGPGALSVGKEIEVLSSKPYFQQLKGLVADFSTQVAEAKGGPEKHEANTAEFVWLKAIRPKWLRPRFSGPHRVMQRTSHAVRLEGKGDIWYHWNQCAVGKPPGRTLDDLITDVRRNGPEGTRQSGVDQRFQMASVFSTGGWRVKAVIILLVLGLLYLSKVALLDEAVAIPTTSGEGSRPSGGESKGGDSTVWRAYPRTQYQEFRGLVTDVVVHEWKNVSICFQNERGSLTSPDVGHSDFKLAIRKMTKTALQAPQRLVGYSTVDDSVLMYDAQLSDPWGSITASAPWGPPQNK
nr:uncharacterized protein LOC117459964 [Pseudochaenichthys georgianus]